MKALVFSIFLKPCTFQIIGFKYQLAPLHGGRVTPASDSKAASYDSISFKPPVVAGKGQAAAGGNRHPALDDSSLIASGAGMGSRGDQHVGPWMGAESARRSPPYTAGGALRAEQSEPALPRWGGGGAS